MSEVGDFVDNFSPTVDRLKSPRTRSSQKSKVRDWRDRSDPEPLSNEAVKIIDGEKYKPSPTMKRFHESKAFVRGIRGPVRGGKSTAMCQEILRRAREQVASEDGIRRTRFVVVRNTYGELKDTTIKTWLDWVPEEYFGKFNRAQGEMKHHIKVGDIDCEVMFRALDKPEDVKKVLSLEVTGAWVNEAREIPRAIVDALGDRVGQFPAKKDGGCTWRGVLLDTNPPDEDHWWYELSEVTCPDGWEFFTQPAGMIEKDGRWVQNPAAENVSNLNEQNYYEVRAAGKRLDYIKVYYGNQYGFVQEGKPVFPEYSDAVHGAKMEPAQLPQKPYYIGIGIVQDAAAIFAQKKPNGQWLVLDELMPDESGIVHFAELLSSKMKSDFPAGAQFRVFGPRAKETGDETDEALHILRRRAVNVSPTRQADAVLRRESVASVLNRLITGEPAVVFSPKCKVTRKALAGGYCYQRIQSAGEERYHEEPARNRYRPIAEAAQFLMIGGGEDAHVFNHGKPKKLEYQPIGVV